MFYTYISLWLIKEPRFDDKRVLQMCENSMPYQLTYTYNIALISNGITDLHASIYVMMGTGKGISEGHPTTKFLITVYLNIKSLVTLKYAISNHI